MNTFDTETKRVPTKEIIIALTIMIFLAALDLTVFPTILFKEIKVLDVEPIYFSLIINQWFLIVVGLILIKFLCPNLELNLKKEGLGKSLKKYLPVAIIFLLIAGFAYFIGLLNYFDYTPSFLKVFIEMFFYNFSVGFLEELYIRGLLLNILIVLLKKTKNSTFKAILISSVLFSLGHIPGMINSNVLIIVLRLIWTLLLGIYFGVIYKTSNNLWIPIISHIIINFSGLAFCFTTHREFPLISVVIIALFSLLLGLLSISYYFKQKELLNI